LTPKAWTATTPTILWKRRQECSFLKKRTKKLLLTELRLFQHAHSKSKVFCFFFFKKEVLAFACLFSPDCPDHVTGAARAMTSPQAS
jgi:hypothetical protein